MPSARETQIRKRYTARLRRGDLLETIVYFSVAVVLALFLADGGATYFLNIKDVTRDDILAAHRVPPQLLGVVPKNTGSACSTRLKIYPTKIRL